MKSLLLLLSLLPLLAISQRYHQPKFELLGPHEICPNLGYTYQNSHAIGIDIGAIGLSSNVNFLALKVGGVMHIQEEYRSYRLRTGLVYQHAVSNLLTFGTKTFISKHPTIDQRGLIVSPSVGIHLGLVQLYYGYNIFKEGPKFVNTNTFSIIIGH